MNYIICYSYIKCHLHATSKLASQLVIEQLGNLTTYCITRQPTVITFYVQVDAITEQIAYPDFIKIDRELNSVYADVSYVHCQ